MADFTRISVLLAWLICIFTSYIAAQSPDPATEYCYGEDGICQVWDDIGAECDKQTSAAYYSCICSSGWVPLNIQYEYPDDCCGNDR